MVKDKNYKCPECGSFEYEHIGDGELKCQGCKCIAGSEHFELNL